MAKNHSNSVSGMISLKLIIIGDKNQGKTSIIKRFIDKKFDDKPCATIVPLTSKTIIKSNEINFEINLWDIPGQDLNPMVTRTFAKDTEGIIFCYEINNEITREHLKNWKESLESFYNIEKIPKILIENKCDLLGDESKYNEGINKLRQTSKKLGCLNYYRTSALNGFNIDEALNFLINEMIKNVKEEGIQDYNEIKLQKSVHVKHKKNNASCC